MSCGLKIRLLVRVDELDCLYVDEFVVALIYQVEDCGVWRSHYVIRRVEIPLRHQVTSYSSLRGGSSR